jgi:hypothetical protein
MMGTEVVIAYKPVFMLELALGLSGHHFHEKVFTCAI